MVYDTGADQNSGNYLQFYIKNAADDAAVLWVNDYDWGPSNGGNWYYSVYDEGEVRDTVDGVLGNASSQVDRERRWFNLEIEALADSLTLLVNGTEVYSGAGMTLTEIGMAMTGPDWRPASVSYWDSVSVSVSPVPEGGATLSMLACALFGLLLVARPSK